MHQAVDRSAGYAIAPPDITTVAVAGMDAVFPVARVFCVGRNYAEHAVEMGHDPDREPPFFFMKPADAVVPPGSLPFPTQTQDLHHEIELVVALAEGGRDIPVERALDHVFGYAVGLDMTRRDLQAEAKKMGRPWDMAKGFDQSAPTGQIRAVEDIGHPTKGAVWLRINGEPRQEGDLDQQIWKVPETISFLSTLVALRPGDLIMTGTPKGVGRVEPGDRLEGHIDGVGDLSVSYEPPEPEGEGGRADRSSASPMRERNGSGEVRARARFVWALQCTVWGHERANTQRKKGPCRRVGPQRRHMRDAEGPHSWAATPRLAEPRCPSSRARAGPTFDLLSHIDTVMATPPTGAMCPGPASSTTADRLAR